MFKSNSVPNQLNISQTISYKFYIQDSFEITLKDNYIRAGKFYSNELI